MTDFSTEDIIAQFRNHLSQKLFPCVAAQDTVSKDRIKCMVADHMACPKDDHAIVSFMYDFIEIIKKADNLFYSAVILFKQPNIYSEDMFESLFWQRLQAIADIDASSYPYDSRVDPDPSSPHFSFSIGEEAFYIIGLHPCSTRKARQFQFPAIVFNPHVQFEKLREKNHYAKMQKVVRKRDENFSGSINPMLSDFGETSEAIQYTGRQYSEDWKCPLIIPHARTKHHSTT